MGDLRWKAVGGWAYSLRLQHPEGVHSPSRPQTEGRSQEAQEEELHHPQEDQAQAQEGEARRVEVLQGGRQRQDQSSETRVSRRGVRSRSLHGRPLRPSILWQVRTHLCLQQTRG